MAMRVMARRFVARLESGSLRSSMMRQTRLRSDKGVLSEEEKAAENIYIKKREQEIREKLARKGVSDAGTPPPIGSTAPPISETPTTANPEASYRNTAIVAGIVAAAAAYWLLSGSTKKEEKEP